MFRFGALAQPNRRRDDCPGAGCDTLPAELYFHGVDGARGLDGQSLQSYQPHGTHARLCPRRGGCPSARLLRLDYGSFSFPHFEGRRKPALEIMSEGEETRQSFSWVRRWSAGLNLIITLAAVLALIAMFNYLSIRHFTRFHWNRKGEAELSERSQQVLHS